jgi:hypothetical protein
MRLSCKEKRHEPDRRKAAASLGKHHLKQLKLPTFLAEYERQAHECARDQPLSIASIESG